MSKVENENTDKTLRIMLKQNKRGLTLTFNGGKATVEEPMVPLAWQLNQQLCLVKPTHLVLVVQNPSEIGYHRCGERYILKVTDLQKYIAFYRGGKHKVAVFLLSPKADMKEVKKKMLSSAQERSFEYSFDIEDVIERNDKRDPGDEDCYLAPGLRNMDIMCAASFELNVPDGLFAQVPRRGLKALHWWIVNMPYKHQPTDQCDLRKRTLISVLTPFYWVFLAWRLVLLPLWFLMQTFTLVVGRLTAFLLGYRPNVLSEDIGYLWDTQVIGGEFIFKDFFQDDEYRLQRYMGESRRVWNSVASTVYKGQLRKGEVKRMAVTPTAILTILFCAWYLFGASSTGSSAVPQVFGLELAAAVLIGLNLGTIIVRLLKPYHLKSSRKFWGIDEEGLSEKTAIVPTILVGVTGLVGYLFFVLYRMGPDEFLGVLAKTAVVCTTIAVTGFLVVKFFNWFSEVRDERMEKREAMRRAQEELDEEAYAQWLALYLAGDRTGAKKILTAAPCDICEDRTLWDKIRLFIANTKPKVCKPYAA